MEQIKCSDLSVGYGKHIIASGLDFSINEGDYLCIVGENGAGKSTLMRTLLGLQKPISGRISYDRYVGRSGIGYLPQQLYAQTDFPATVKEIVQSGCQGKIRRKPFYGRKEKAVALSNMKYLHIEELADRSYRELSGGQQQKVLLARALCAAGRILFLDEPVTGLDPEATGEMYSLIDRINKECMTIVMISHDISLAVKYANKILHIGKKIFFRKKEDYINSEIGINFLKREGM